MEENRVVVLELQVNTGDSSQELESVKKQLEGIEDEVRNVSKATRESQAAASFEKLNKVVDESVLSIQELGTAADNYKNIALAAGVTSPIGREALERAAQLENQMDQLNRSVAQVAEGGRTLNTAMQLGTGVIAGYSAFQGVTALMGKENEELAETMVKLQAAQAALIGVKELSIALDRKGLLVTTAQSVAMGVLSATTLAYNTVVGTSTGLMKVFRLALISTGIGAIVVGLGLLIANFDKVQKVVADVVDWFGSLGIHVVRLIEWFNSLGAMGKAIAWALAAPIMLAIEAYQFFFGEVEKGTADLMEAEKKRAEELQKQSAEIAKQHGARMEQIQKELDATIKASNSKIDALKLELNTLEAQGKSSAAINLQILEEQLAQTKAVLDANKKRIDSWVKYYSDQAALRGESQEDFKKRMKAQGVDLEFLQNQANELLKENEDTVKYSENAITKFKREQNEKRSKDLKNALTKDKAEQLDYQEEVFKSYTDWQKKINDANFIDVEDDGIDLFEEFEIQAEESLSKFETFVASVSHILKRGTENIPDEFAQMLSDVSAGIDMAMETFSAVNDLLNELGNQRSKRIGDRAENDLKNLEAQKKKELSNEKLSANQKLEIEKKFAMAQYEIEKKTAEAQDVIARRQFQRDKALRLVEITINTASAIAKGIATFGPPPSPLGIAAIASAGIIGAAQAAIVASSRFEGSASSITPPSFDTPSIGGGSDGGGNSNNSGGDGGQNDITTLTDALLNPPPIVISQVEINKVSGELARLENISML